MIEFDAFRNGTRSFVPVRNAKRTFTGKKVQGFVVHSLKTVLVECFIQKTVVNVELQCQVCSDAVGQLVYAVANVLLWLTIAVSLFRRAVDRRRHKRRRFDADNCLG